MIYKDTKSTYSQVMTLLFLLKDRPEYSHISHLVYVLDQDNFYNFIKYYGGTTIRVPTSQEISELVDVLVYYKSLRDKGVTKKEAKSHLVNKYDGVVGKKYDELVKHLEEMDIEFGDG